MNYAERTQHSAQCVLVGTAQYMRVACDLLFGVAHRRAEPPRMHYEPPILDSL